jgi:hypothetical protein
MRESLSDSRGTKTINKGLKSRQEEDGLVVVEAEVKERSLYLVGTPLKNLRREKFCQLYASDREFFGNGTQSYIEAYDVDVIKTPKLYFSAGQQAYELLKDHEILNRVNEILQWDDNNAHMDKQIWFAATQNSDMKAKVSALELHAKLHNRITEKVEHTHRMDISKVNAEIIRRKTTTQSS